MKTWIFVQWEVLQVRHHPVFGCSKSIMETPKQRGNNKGTRRQWRHHSDVFIVNFEQIWYIVVFGIHCWLWTSNFLFEIFKIGLKLSHFIPIFPAISITAQNWSFPLGIIHSVRTQNFTKKKYFLSSDTRIKG